MKKHHIIITAVMMITAILLTGVVLFYLEMQSINRDIERERGYDVPYIFDLISEKITLEKENIEEQREIIATARAVFKKCEKYMNPRVRIRQEIDLNTSEKILDIIEE